MKGPYTPNPDVVFKRLEDRMVLVTFDGQDFKEKDIESEP